MNNKKLVSIEEINILLAMVDNLISNLKDSDCINLALNINMYIKNSILEEDKLFINNLKRSIYLQMKNAKTEEENKRLYEIYQTLKGS